MKSTRERLGELYASLAPKLAALLSARLSLPGDLVVDAVHDVFVELLRHSSIGNRVLSLQPNEQTAYLYVAARNRAFKLAKRDHSAQIPLETLSRILVDDRTAHQIAEGELRDLVQTSLRELSEPYRTVLELLLLQHRQASEIAASVGRPVNTVYQQIHRGLEQLRGIVRPKLKK